MDGKVYTIIAKKGAGKTNFVENEILNLWGFRKNYIYDKNEEYKGFKNEFLPCTNKEDFLEKISTEASQPRSYSNIIFEEATHYIRRHQDQDGRLLEQTGRTWHTKNIVVFIFLSMLAVPKELFSDTTFWVIFQTGDDIEAVKRMYKGKPEVLNAYLDVCKKTKGTTFDRSTKIYGDERSKEFYHYHRIISQ
jgi:hypothetical protein